MWVLAALCGVACAVQYAREPRRLSNGVLLLCTAMLTLLALMTAGGETQDFVIAYLVNPLLLVAMLGYVVLVVFLLVNGVILLVREGRSVAMLLPILAAVVMILAPGAVLYGLSSVGPDTGPLLPSVTIFVMMMTAYGGFVFGSFATFSLLYRFRKAPRDAGSVVVLGSRIIDGRVPPLLASRIDRGIELYRAATSASGGRPLLICSGGQGPDESRSEASAMGEYARERGAQPDDLLLEEKSTTTAENLAFSLQIAREHGRGDERMLVATNDFHIFRTALLTRRLGIKAHVAAAKTARYYVPAAYLREFVAVVRDYLWIHLCVLVLVGGFVGFTLWESFQYN